jgi:hypothetical protein
MIFTVDVGVGFTQLKERWTIVFGGITTGKTVQGPTGMRVFPHCSVEPVASCQEMPVQG